MQIRVMVLLLVEIYLPMKFQIDTVYTCSCCVMLGTNLSAKNNKGQHLKLCERGRVLVQCTSSHQDLSSSKLQVFLWYALDRIFINSLKPKPNFMWHNHLIGDKWKAYSNDLGHLVLFNIVNLQGGGGI